MALIQRYLPHKGSVEQMAKWIKDVHIRGHLDKEAAYYDLEAFHQQMAVIHAAKHSALGLGGNPNQAVALAAVQAGLITLVAIFSSSV